MAHHQPVDLQAQLAYEAAISSPCPDWRAVAERFRAAVRTDLKRQSKAPKANAPEIADYNVDRIKLKCRSPRIAVRFMDGEAVFTHVPSAPGKPLNVGEHCAWRLRCIARAEQCSRGSDFMSTIVRCQCLRYFRFVAWRRTNCLTRRRATLTRRVSVRAVARSGRWQCCTLTHDAETYCSE
jgi:hypothetical protein